MLAQHQDPILLRGGLCLGGFLHRLLTLTLEPWGPQEQQQEEQRRQHGQELAPHGSAGPQGHGADKGLRG